MTPRPPADPTNPEERLAALIGCRTVSAPDERDEAEFVAFRGLFARLYPRLHAELALEVVNEGTLLFHWPGSSDRDPMVLMAHYDVVPAPPEQWSVDPFAGMIADGQVHGRGALDDKGPLVCLAEAVEGLLAEGFVPAHDVWLSFGHDEEVFGSGARTVAELLDARGVRPWLVNDEGGAIVDNPVPGIGGRHAMIGIVEKGTVDIELLATGEGGHASSPAPHGPIARLAQAITRIEKSPATPHLTPPVRAMVQALSASAPAPVARVIEQALKLDRPLAELLARLGPETAAMVRTTMAPTRLSGSPANNVLPTEARVNLNVRLAVGDTISDLVARLTKLLKGLDIAIVSIKGDDPPPVSRIDSDAWAHLVAAIGAVDPAIRPVPFVLMGGTDSRHFAPLCDAVYRFAPLEMSAEQRRTIHAAGESLSIASLHDGIAFHRALLTMPRPAGS